MEKKYNNGVHPKDLLNENCFNCKFHVISNCLEFNLFAEADYTLDDSFWNEESPVGKCQWSH